MNFWQIVMLMLWLAMMSIYVWAIIAVVIDVTRREDVSGLIIGVLHTLRSGRS